MYQMDYYISNNHLVIICNSIIVIIRLRNEYNHTLASFLHLWYELVQRLKVREHPMNIKEFDKQYCKKLNAQQKEAVHSVDGPVLLLAVPGSGKTTVLVTRLGYMVCCCGIAPQNILTMTYTKAATGEMKQRFASMFGDSYAKNMEFYTINSLATQIIKYYANNYGSGQVFELVETDHAIRIITDLYQQINHDYATESIIKDIQTGITYVKNMMLTGEAIDKIDVGVENFVQIYHGYCNALRQNRRMDFDDQLSYSLTILKKYPDVLEHFQNRFPYICVDESQDTSRIQHEIIKLLAGKYSNIFMVGDEDQSIYGFRAAYPDALLNFEKDYSNAKVLLMENNYRSTREIVAVADEFISKNEKRHPKALKATRESGKQVQLVNADSCSIQYAYLLEVGRQCSSETAILYRNNDSALPLIDMFERRGVPYNCKKFEDSFFTHRVVSDIRDIICFAHDPHNAELFMRIYYKFGSPISKKTAQFACDQSKLSGKSILHELASSPELVGTSKETAIDLQTVLPELQKNSAETALVDIWTTLKYKNHVAANGLDPRKIDILRELARREKTPMDLLSRLDTLRSLIQNHINRSENHLILSTIHSSKGLEYERVYLLDVFDGILPSKKKHECKEDVDLHNYEEDRRVYYVGMTRAKNELYLFNCKDKASEFTAELETYIPDELHDSNDLFYSLKTDLCGKAYTDKVKGKGTVKAQCGDMLFVDYPNNEPELKSLVQLLADRDISVQYSTRKKKKAINATTKPTADVNIVPGMKLKHKLFGEGVVDATKDDVADVRFGTPYGLKQIMLSMCIQKGIIEIIK